MFVWEKVFLGGILISFIFIRSSVGDDVEKECIIANKDCINNEHIHFYLYSNGDDNENHSPINLSGNIDESTFSRLDKTYTYKSMKIMVHGATGHNWDQFSMLIRRGYYAFGEKLLIFAVDYEKLLDDLACLEQGLLNIPTIATCAVKVLEDILQFIPSIDYLHGIGFSFGTQILGKISELMKEKKNDKLAFDKITALETPIPRMEHRWKYLDANSAIIVEVLHTNGGNLGHVIPHGTVDIYFNGGLNQPGCEVHGFPLSHKCSHIKVYAYFAESLIYRDNDCGFFAYLQDSSEITDMSLLGPLSNPYDSEMSVKFGEYGPNNLSGIYHTKTNPVRPFALNKCEDQTVRNMHDKLLSKLYADVKPRPEIGSEDLT